MLRLDQNATAWMDSPEEQQAYREWKNNPMTLKVMDLVRREIHADALPVGPQGIMTSGVEYLYGQLRGAHRILSRMMNLDAERHVPEEIVSDYELEKNLMDSGYSKKDAQAIVKRHNEGVYEDA